VPDNLSSLGEAADVGQGSPRRRTTFLVRLTRLGGVNIEHTQRTRSTTPTHAVSLMDATPTDDFTWLEPNRFRNLAQARESLAQIWHCGATPDLLASLRGQLDAQFLRLDDCDAAISNLSRFVSASRSPASLLALFERDTEALPNLMQVFSTSPSLSNRLIADPESFDLLRASDGQEADRLFLIDELVAEVNSVEQTNRAALRIRKFVSRETARIAYGEFVRGMTPDKVGRQLAHVADAAIEAALQFADKQLARRRDRPQLDDGRTPEVTVIALGSLGGQELGYGDPLKLIFLFDRINYLNKSHRDYYTMLVNDVIAILRSDDPRGLGYAIDSRSSPMFETGTLICSVRDAARIYESAGQTWQRLAFVKARTAAGSMELGNRFLEQLEPWIYRRHMSRESLSAFAAVRQKLQRRTDDRHATEGQRDSHHGSSTNEITETPWPEEAAVNGAAVDVLRDPGGRQDIELTVQFVQLLHGGDLELVRKANTVDAIVALERSGCLTHQEASLLAENYARLCRLQHHLSVMFDSHRGTLPSTIDQTRRLAYQLGIRNQDGTAGDLAKFRQLLSEILELNRTIINHLLLDTPESDGDVPIETALVLDPEPDQQLVSSTLSTHGLKNPLRSMQDLIALSRESVTFLSPQRCRQFFAALAPALLKQIAKSPDPDRTLGALVAVTDSLGAKATLWELLRVNRPTMELMVRLCAGAPYLSRILTKHPGMIDELIDSLLMNRLPSPIKIEAQSIEWCRGAEDPMLILQNFKNSMHLNIGVRDILGKEPLEAIHRALADTAESCLRRIAEHEQEQLAQQYGDPRDETASDEGERAQLIMLAFGKLAGREPNYHSDLDVVFLYSGNGETQRRVGGPRKTTTNQHFFNVLAQRIHDQVNHIGPQGSLYELDGRLRPTESEGVLTLSCDAFLKRFRQNTAPLWQRLALCKARAISGSMRVRRRTDRAIAEVICETAWHDGMLDEMRLMRQQNELTASVDNLKRGRGGTFDVEMVAQMLTLRHAHESPGVIHPGTIDSITALSDAGYIGESDAMKLITSYRVLRRVEANLRLLDHRERHELPSDEKSLRDLAFLMNEADPAMIQAQCQNALQNIRSLFDQFFSHP